MMETQDQKNCENYILEIISIIFLNLLTIKLIIKYSIIQ